MNKTLSMIAFFILIFQLQEAGGEVFPYHDGETVLGTVETYKTKADESLIEIARKFDLGYNEITDANPALDPFVPGQGASVEIPTAWILPDTVLHEGIVINVAELRLYYFYEVAGRRFVRTYPIGIGSEGHDTPIGEFKVIEKIVHPAWHVPESIKEEKPYLPDVVPPGPDNPLGSHAMRLSDPTILIHGTNKPFAVGRRASHGCLRLYPEDIPSLFKSTPPGVRVTIVNQPVKVGVKDGRVYVEAHRVDPEYDVDYFEDAVQMLTKKDLIGRVDTKKLHNAVEEKKGIPVDISD
ncbi:MAG: L,D-transpeptidase family protein [Nitrospiraceae bacterium]|nr:L,D-transpeptidase family protein [Nitrospiraceae bacterium]